MTIETPRHIPARRCACGTRPIIDPYASVPSMCTRCGMPVQVIAVPVKAA